ncbi:MAG: MXAN_2562 family outer membrane beta-barrel protein [Myxococcota bacterium]
MNRLVVALGVVVSLISLQATAEAQIELQDRGAIRPSVDSPERFALELRVGPYTPDDGRGAFDAVFDDLGPLLAFEFDINAYRLKNVGMIGVGLSFGWVNYSGNAFSQGGTVRSSEDTDLTLFPLSALAVVRIDVLPRLLNIPIVFAGKLGPDFVIWTSSTGENDFGGVSVGLRWGAQVALELDFFDRRAARALDEEWGINHTFVFFEIFGSVFGDVEPRVEGSTDTTSLPLGPENGWAWTAGLGFIL